MLNTLWNLAASLQKANIKTASVRDEYLLCPKKPGVRIFLNSEGQVAGMAILPKETMATVRHWAPSNHEAFPSGNTAPIFLGDGDKKQEKMKRWLNSLKNAPQEGLKNILAEVESTGLKDAGKKFKTKGGAPDSTAEENCPNMACHLAPFIRGASSFK